MIVEPEDTPAACLNTPELTGADNNSTEEPEQLPVRETDGQKPAKPPRWKLITVAAVAAAVIIFAFIWEATSDRRTPQDTDRYDRHNDHQTAVSEIQEEINGLSWIHRDFLPVNEYSRPGTPLDEVKGVVIHYVGNPNTTADQNRSYFATLAVTKDRYASSNFIICLDGEVIQCVPVDEIAYASNIRNADTLSIELCHPDETGRFTDETYASAVNLTAFLCDRYQLDTDDIIRHYDVTEKLCPKYFVENEDAWQTFKADVEKAMGQEREQAEDGDEDVWQFGKLGR